MKTMKKIAVRSYQGVFYLLSFFLPFREPEVIAGDNPLEGIPDVLLKYHKKRVLIVTDPGLWKLGLLDPLFGILEKEDIAFNVYNETQANPTIDNIEAGVKMYQAMEGDALIAFGGGSSMDCAKGIGARIARPHTPISKMRGVLKVGRRLPLLIAIPTTAGTGSETTLAAVITDAKSHEKYAINDPHLIPKVAVLAPTLTLGLPPKITSTTGMDALTHAVEAYIGRANTRKTKRKALEALHLIKDNLYEVYVHPTNLVARRNMLLAAYDAGVAFTRAYVGYVHALAHALGGLYGTPHGLANAIILPYVLDAYGPSAEKKLAELSAALKLADPKQTTHEKAQAFIAWVRSLNKAMNIPDHLPEIKQEDIPMLSERAHKEGVPLYPVPRLWDRAEFAAMYTLIRG